MSQRTACTLSGLGETIRRFDRHMQILSITKIAASSLVMCTTLVGTPLEAVAQTQNLIESQIRTSRASKQKARINYESYILGPGDVLEIEVLDLPEFSGVVSVGPDGTIYLPRLRASYVEGLTIEETRLFLTEKFEKYIINPELYIRPISYRPIRVYVGGEVKRPGYYTLSGLQEIKASTVNKPKNISSVDSSRLLPKLRTDNFTSFPTVFDAIQNAQGITAYSNLSQVAVTRRQPSNLGGGRIRTTLNFLSLITEGNESQNIRLFDGDVITISKSPTVLRQQLLQAVQTNLSPQYLEVYVSGRVENAGPVTLPQGSSLVQAIDIAGGTKVIHGKVEFIRFTREGEIDKRIFGFKSDAPSGDYRNPLLMSGDLIRLRETPLTKSLSVLGEVTAPALSVYSLYSIFDNINN